MYLIIISKAKIKTYTIDYNKVDWIDFRVVQ